MCSTEKAGGYERLRLPCDTDWTAWHRFCFGRPAGGAVAASADAHGGSNGAAAMAEDGAEGGEQPSLPVLLSMEPVRASPAAVFTQSQILLPTPSMVKLDSSVCERASDLPPEARAGEAAARRVAHAATRRVELCSC